MIIGKGGNAKTQSPGIRALRSLDGDQARFRFDKFHHQENRNLLDRTPRFDAQNAGRHIARLTEVSLKLMAVHSGQTHKLSALANLLTAF